MTAERKIYEVFFRVTEEGAYANLALKDGLPGEPPSVVSRASAWVYTALEKLNYCDYMLARFAKGRIQPRIRALLRLFSAELFFMGAPDHAVVSRAVALTAQIGKAPLKGYVNGVLRSMARARASGSLPALPDEPEKRLSVEYGCPEFMAAEYIEKYGLSFTEEMLSSRVKGVALRPVYPHGSGEIKAHLDELGIPYGESRLVPGALVAGSFPSLAQDELFLSGVFTVQSESAMLACRCLDPKPGMRVLDACAAPGGKTAYLFDLMERRGSVSAWDIHPHRVGLIRSTLERLGVSQIEPEQRDASVHDPALDSSFDAVLLDVPCSGLGGGSKPEAMYRRTEQSIEELARVQSAILSACSDYVAVGGTLVYSTCTLSDREDEQVVESFLKADPRFRLRSIAEHLPEYAAERGGGGMMRLYPNLDGTEGFFIAKLERVL
ncbi:MAG: 16S rRNA (cytosine(967)-C(5))-methyltransferase RsmB [Clostridia bacterium]|nr:16S rRNA (cytosine(967)-C(5))-methyltransferase RsmB [Clostridia bacterium]